MDRDAFDSLVTRMDTAMIVLTASDGEERAGCLVGFHTAEQHRAAPVRDLGVEDQPHLRRRAAGPVISRSTSSPRQDRDLAEHFGGLTGDEVDKFADIEWNPGPTVCPCSRGARTGSSPVVAQHDDGGDHVCVIAEPIDVSATAEFTPLRFHSVQRIEPGHDPD